MVCKKCQTEFKGNFCPNCGSPVIKTGKLLGFRSNKFWKKSISILYMAFLCLVAIGTITDFSTTDSAYEVISSVQLLILLLSPYIFLSNFKLRNHLPLFKEHQTGHSIAGFIVIIFLVFLIGTLLNPATYCEHEWIEQERLEATCTNDGKIISHCDLCDTDSTEYIDRKGHKFVNKENTDEKDQRICSVCGEIETNHTHKWIKATCEDPKICKECGTTKGKKLGHSTNCGICTRCDKELRKQSPVTIQNWTHTIDFLGGVEWNFRIKNNTNKQIKYVTLQWDCYNAVGDLIKDEYSRKHYVKIQVTGPINANAISDTIRNTTKFYNYNLNSYVMTDIIVEYMDGTTEQVTKYHDNSIE